MMKNFFYNSLYLGFLLIFSLIAAEILCALFSPSTFVKTDILGRKIRNGQGPLTYTVSHENETYWDYLPNQKGRMKFLNDYDVRWEINSLGLRSQEPSKDAGEMFRILVLGDSQTFGLGVDQEKTFSAQLQALLTAKTQNQIEVLNAGVSGYGTFEASWKLERIVNKVQPNLIVLVIFVDNALVPDEGNDLWNNYVRIKSRNGASADHNPGISPSASVSSLRNVSEKKGTKPIRPKIPFLAEHSHLYGVLSLVKNKIQGEKSHLEKVKAYRTMNKENPELQRVWEKTRELILETAKVGRQASGASTILLYLPGLSSLELNDQSAEEELKKTGLPVVSTFGTLESERKGNSMSLRFKHNSHYNDFAHRLIAKQLESFIIENNLLFFN